MNDIKTEKEYGDWVICLPPFEHNYGNAEHAYGPDGQLVAYRPATAPKMITISGYIWGCNGEYNISGDDCRDIKHGDSKFEITVNGKDISIRWAE